MPRTKPERSVQPAHVGRIHPLDMYGLLVRGFRPVYVHFGRAECTVNSDNAIPSPLKIESRGTLIVKGLVHTERARANGFSVGIGLAERSGD